MGAAGVGTLAATSLADAVIVPEGYSAQIVYALGDPLTASTPAFKNDGTDADFTNRAGDHATAWRGLAWTRKASLRTVPHCVT
ncbi:MAG: DUF839 domain-containing protein [Hydrogenophaga sp.]|uniref:DUF839 domain-containing protein n=1 Tax=Hydrogenophaga sp. TaxID=1904254 RepID=UPI001BC63F38|nr:DUF839 domain-containing protein [Hydrogenophaga sp.]MBS3912399.1 DUF839 domain-containing protein [Hydrogenophaga sp.]MDO9148238.1 DUF839 domain-containing protein [Hydrogenophaga sp.]MDO9606078.1 DUF839 domain-containing protein [Hydrogenophaga sp.]MDP2164813.1 DUF839 domain-containing protein [Hydrogenophaga sp.]MDP3477407.1 DUF839 domain-containing protein [Hydrogenophaga sp.]